ncbi:MAG: glycine/D-amino acid oxidase-like deaminating enzyme [Gammaproteobacteria bacterium]|jgi:glycine/D-amino acid oxidase-like deaminating enzyme
MLNEHSPINFSAPLPAAVDVVVIGAGVIGISIAWFLAARGITVAVCEKGRVAGEQSSRNWGWIRKHGRDRAELPIVMESIEHWESISRELDQDIGFARHGVVYLAQNDQELERRAQWLEVAAEHGLDTRMLGSFEVAELIKANGGNWVGGAYTASDARAEPFLAVPAIARALGKKGVTIVENCAVRTLDIAAGRVAGVVTEQGMIKCSTVVCAGGAWASLFARQAGYDFPQLTVRATVTRTAPAPEIFRGNAASATIAFRRRQDGGYTLAASGHFEHFVGRDSLRYLRPFAPNILRSYNDFSLRFEPGLFNRLRATARWSADDVSPFEKARVLNPDPSPAALDEIRKQLRRQLPSLADVAFAESWAGMIDTTPDIVPVMDKVEGVPGFFIAAGFSGHGFGIGPGAGRVMADLMLGNAVGHDLTRFRLSRFREGALELGPAL